jgi:hypothetical protein
MRDLQHRTQRAPRAHRVEALVDPLEREALGDHLVEPEPAVEVEPGEPREVAPRACPAVARAHDPSLAHQRAEAQRHLPVDRHLAEDGQRAAGPGAVERELQRRLAARALEHEVGTAPGGERLHRRGLRRRVAVVRTEQVGRAHRPRERQPGRVAVDGDDHLGLLQPRTLHRVQADRAAADHHRRRTRLDPGHPHRGAHAGHHAAADQAGAIERDGLRHRDRARLGHHRVLRVCGGHGEVVEHPVAVEPVARAAVEHAPGRLVTAERFAQDRLVALAVEAVPAVRVPRADDVIADLHLRDRRPHPLDHAGALVPQHDRQRIGQGALDHLEVGVAQPACMQAHQHVARLERLQRDVLDREAPAGLVQHRRLVLHAGWPPAGALTVRRRGSAATG